MGLITTTEAQNALTALTAAQIAELSTTITQAGLLMELYCENALVSKSYLEYVEPGQSRTLRLAVGNLTSIDSLRAGATAMMTVAGPSTADRATITQNVSGDPPFTTASGITLFSRSSGVDTTTTLSYADYVTLDDLAAAINAVAGWTASVAGTYGTFATADLTVDPGPKGAKVRGVDLYGIAFDIDDFTADYQSGLIRLTGPWVSDVFAYPQRPWGSAARFGQVKVSYTAGYSAVPEDLKRACILTVKALFDTESITGQFSQEKATLGNETYFYSFAGTPDIIPPTAKLILDRKYRRTSIT